MLLDMIMPVMGGREAFSRIREMDEEVPIIITSGFSRENNTFLTQQKGVTGFLKKPFRRTERADAVAKSIIPRA